MIEPGLGGIVYCTYIGNPLSIIGVSCGLKYLRKVNFEVLIRSVLATLEQVFPIVMLPSHGALVWGSLGVKTSGFRLKKSIVMVFHFSE